MLSGIYFGPKDQVVRIGETVLFECYAPTAVSVAWKRNGRIVDSDRDTRFKVSTSLIRSWCSGVFFQISDKPDCTTI